MNRHRGAVVRKKKARFHVGYGIRIIEVKAIAMHFSHRIDDRRNVRIGAGQAWLQARGRMDEAIEGHFEVEISICQVDKGVEPSPDTATLIGALIQVKPRPQVLLEMPPRLFDRLWAIAAEGQRDRCGSA